MWSDESEALKSRYTSDNNVVWLQTGVFLIALKIWQQNATSFRSQGNYPREVTDQAITCWGSVRACHNINPSRIIQIHSQ